MVVLTDNRRPIATLTPLQPHGAYNLQCLALGLTWESCNIFDELCNGHDCDLPYFYIELKGVQFTFICIIQSSMKRIIYLFILGVFMSVSMNAQEAKPTILLGAKAGLNISNVYDSEGDEFSSSPKTGLAAGVFMHLPIGTFIGIQPEVMFSQKGYTSTGTVLGFDYTMTRTSNYVDIPVFFAVKPTQYTTLLLGPQYSYLIKQTNKLVTPITNSEVEKEFDNENIRKNTFGIAMGLDLRYQILVLSGRVGWDLFNNNGDGTSTTPRYKNVTGQITLGVAL